MRFDFITIFPQIFDSYLNESILARAQKKRLLAFHVHDLRKYANDKHNKVDDKPYGGGPGMVMMVGPIYRAIEEIKRSRDREIKSKTRIILLSAKGRQFTQADTVRLAKKYKRLIFICGRYEGVDERVAKYLVDEEISIGPYVLTGGELPAMVIADAVSRYIPGVLGKAESLKEESFTTLTLPSPVEGEGTKLFPSLDGRGKGRVTEYPQYTRPEIFSPKRGLRWAVPKVLLSGNHKKIAAWRTKQRT